MPRGHLAIASVALFGLLLTCQDYPFEVRVPKRVAARKINEVIATLRPTDVLLVVDNSGTMAEEREELKDNVEDFVTSLVDNRVDFHLGIVSTDLECNVP